MAGPLSERQLIDGLLTILRSRLPATWQVDLASDVRYEGIPFDALVTLTAPNGPRAELVIETKSRLDPGDISRLVSLAHRAGIPNKTLLVVAPFLSPRARELLSEANVAYADATGNLRLTLANPPIYIELTGANTNPNPEHQAPLRSLRGRVAGRIVRALCDYRPPYSIRQLAQRANASPASASRVVELLEREALLTRGPAGEVIDVRWAQLIQRWTQDYRLTTSNRVTSFLDPRGLDAFLDKLQGATSPYAVTGSLAAVRFTSIAVPRLAVAYFADSAAAATSLALRRAERGINVLLVEPFDVVVFERTTREDQITYAAVSQVAADLLTSPGRGPEEGDALLHWMEDTQDAWRT